MANVARLPSIKGDPAQHLRSTTHRVSGLVPPSCPVIISPPPAYSPGYRYYRRILRTIDSHFYPLTTAKSQAYGSSSQSGSYCRGASLHKKTPSIIITDNNMTKGRDENGNLTLTFDNHMNDEEVEIKVEAGLVFPPKNGCFCNTVEGLDNIHAALSTTKGSKENQIDNSHTDICDLENFIESGQSEAGNVGLLDEITQQLSVQNIKLSPCLNLKFVEDKGSEQNNNTLLTAQKSDLSPRQQFEDITTNCTNDKKGNQRMTVSAISCGSEDHDRDFGCKADVNGFEHQYHGCQKKSFKNLLSNKNELEGDGDVADGSSLNRSTSFIQDSTSLLKSQDLRGVLFKSVSNTKRVERNSCKCSSLDSEVTTGNNDMRKFTTKKGRSKSVGFNIESIARVNSPCSVDVIHYEGDGGHSEGNDICTENCVKRGDFSSENIGKNGEGDHLKTDTAGQSPTFRHCGDKSPIMEIPQRHHPVTSTPKAVLSQKTCHMGNEKEYPCSSRREGSRFFDESTTVKAEARQEGSSVSDLSGILNTFSQTKSSENETFEWMMKGHEGRECICGSDQCSFLQVNDQSNREASLLHVDSGGGEHPTGASGVSRKYRRLFCIWLETIYKVFYV